MHGRLCLFMHAYVSEHGILIITCMLGAAARIALIALESSPLASISSVGMDLGLISMDVSLTAGLENPVLLFLYTSSC